jgi:predicted dehydrogenase
MFVAIRIIHVGVGVRGTHWVGFVKEHPDVVSVACVDVSGEALDRIRQSFGEDDCPCFTDLEEAFRSVQADAVLIATPSMLHAEHALTALDAGYAVLTEKPFALTVEEGRRVLARAREVGKPVVVAENYRFWPAERTIRKLVRDGALGKIKRVILKDLRDQSSGSEPPWFSQVEYPQLQEIAIHHFDSLRGFFDCNPLNITTRVWNPAKSDYEKNACTEAKIEMEGGISVEYFGTLLASRYWFTLKIQGEKGTVWSNRKYIFFRRRRGLLYRPVKHVEVPLGDGAKYPRGGTTALIESFRDAVLHGRAAETRGEDNIWSVAMVEAGKTSDREGRSVSLSELMGADARPSES